jgi:hypothetical protein
MVVLGLLDILQKLLDNAAICDYEERQRGDGNFVNLNPLHQFNAVTTSLI